MCSVISLFHSASIQVCLWLGLDRIFQWHCDFLSVSTERDEKEERPRHRAVLKLTLRQAGSRYARPDSLLPLDARVQHELIYSSKIPPFSVKEIPKVHAGHWVRPQHFESPINSLVLVRFFLSIIEFLHAN